MQKLPRDKEGGGGTHWESENARFDKNRECSQVRMVDTISQPGCAECGAGGLVLTDYRPYAFLRALLLIGKLFSETLSIARNNWTIATGLMECR